MNLIKKCEVIEKIEILNEVGAGIIADFNRALEKMNIEIEDESNSIVILYWQTVELKNDFIKMGTMLELNNAQAQLNFIRDYVKKLGEV